MTAALLLLSLSTHATAAPRCPTDPQLQKLSAFEERLRGADSVDEARALAQRKVARTERAVRQARRLVPHDAELAEQQERLDAFARDLGRAETRYDVARRFTELRTEQAGAACHYSTGEIVAIAIGFVLGILPGILLLVLLC